ncbi:MAG: hypothetical protein GVX90_05585 [Alphaproteobacteria bacterium]|nr:hypothetical protein [Alphaproteobacteria bacterium]
MLQINETIRASSPAPVQSMRAMASEAVSVSATPVEPGMVETGVSISITYELVEDEAQD